MARLQATFANAASGKDHLEEREIASGQLAKTG